MSEGTLYRRVLGVRYDALPDAVRRLHEVSGPARWTGACEVERGASFVARAAGWIAGLPPPTDGMRDGFCYQVTPEGDGEIWSRGFIGMRSFTTRQWTDGRLLYERAGPMTMGFSVPADGAGLRLALVRCCLFGLPLPEVLYPRIEAAESDVDGVFCFDVSARFPTGGLLVRYRGWLKPQA